MTNVTFDDEMGRLQRALARCEDMVARLREPDRARSRARDKSRGGPRRPSHRQDGAPVLDLSRSGALEPDVGDRQEPGWTDLEEERE